jgi:hypothetical protein
MTLLKLKDQLATIDLFANVGISAQELQRMLNTRDSLEFDHKWTEACQRVAQAEVIHNLEEEDVDTIAEIREIAFKRAYEVCQSSELSGYVSDDFDMIARAVRAGCLDGWLNELWSSYRSGQFPN